VTKSITCSIRPKFQEGKKIGISLELSFIAERTGALHTLDKNSE
jgi:hypothetical protein